jgi:hypothetical protein
LGAISAGSIDRFETEKEAEEGGGVEPFPLPVPVLPPLQLGMVMPISRANITKNMAILFISNTSLLRLTYGLYYDSTSTPLATSWGM